MHALVSISLDLSLPPSPLVKLACRVDAPVMRHLRFLNFKMTSLKLQAVPHEYKLSHNTSTYSTAQSFPLQIK